MSRVSLRLAGLLALSTAATVIVGCGPDADVASTTSDPLGATSVTQVDLGAGEATWKNGSGPVASLTQISGRVRLPKGTTKVTLALQNAEVVGIPDACRPSTTTRRRSAIVARTLMCEPEPGTRKIGFTALAVGETGDVVTGTSRAVARGEVEESRLPGRAITGGPSSAEPETRLLSSPDFLNADVGDLDRGPSRWSPERSTNSTNSDYETALARVMDDWKGLDPAAVLVAGDLVDGRWGYDDADTGTFGPVETTKERRAALRRAARTYYPQWRERFTDRDLSVLPAPGDHEYGDNPWPRRKRVLASTFRNEFARAFTQRDGEPVYADHPDGPAAGTAYAVRPTPEIQVVSLDVFDITPGRERIGLDRQQRDWFEQVLAQAEADDVPWVVVQGHVPVLYPVRARGSSRLHYPGGTDSDLWRLMRRYGVDLYLCGEVHDVTAAQRGGVVQISHGGLFQFGLTNALVMDVYGDRMYLRLRDYTVKHRDDGPRLWETRRAGMPSSIEVRGEPSTIGTATLFDGELRSPSGILRPLG